MENKIKELNQDPEYIKDLSISELEKIIEYTNEKYRNETPVVSDSVYDMVEDFFKIKESKKVKF